MIILHTTTNPITDGRLARDEESFAGCEPFHNLLLMSKGFSRRHELHVGVHRAQHIALW